MSARPPFDSAQPPAARAGLLLPMGGGYNELMPGLAATLYRRSQGGRVRVAVLPASFSSNPTTISAEERSQNLQAAEARRRAIEAWSPMACSTLSPPAIK